MKWYAHLVILIIIMVNGAVLADEAPYLKTSEALLSGFHIDRRYMSMEGPTETKLIALAPQSKSPFLWIRSFSVEVLGSDGQPESPEYLCHAWASIPPQPRSHDNGLLTISAGLMNMDFPEGFAMVVPNSPAAPVHILAQAENYNQQPIHKELTFKFRFTYLEDEDAKRLGLRRLEAGSVNTTVSQDASFTAESTPSQNDMHDHGMTMSMSSMVSMPDHNNKVMASDDHFMVPPGRHIYRSDVPSTNDLYQHSAIQYIKMHLHPYGESVELFDKTVQKSVWIGRAHNVKDRAVLESTDYYGGGGKGLPLYHDHTYEVITTYNNTTSKPVDAMGFLRIYFEAPSS